MNSATDESLTHHIELQQLIPEYMHLDFQTDVSCILVAVMNTVKNPNKGLI